MKQQKLNWGQGHPNRERHSMKWDQGHPNRERHSMKWGQTDPDYSQLQDDK